MDEVFKALADPSRRLLLDSLNARTGQSLRDLCAELSMARQSVSKHLAVLEAANLVTTVWRGQGKTALPQCRTDQCHRRPLDQPIRPCAGADTRRPENRIGDRTDEQHTEFVYTTYIRTTPERLWQAITDPAFSHRYMGHAMVSDWQKGSTYVWEDRGLKSSTPNR